MEFDCWTGILVEGKPYTIVEKIRYKEKDSDDRWTEYGLAAEGEEKRLWLTVEGDNLSCTLSRTVHRSTAPQGYGLRDKGEQIVTGVHPSGIRRRIDSIGMWTESVSFSSNHGRAAHRMPPRGTV